MHRFLWALLAVGLAAIAIFVAPMLLAPRPSAPQPAGADITLINASYDPPREFYADLNAAFLAQWRGPGRLHISMSHGGSAAQARAIIEGLPADVATLASAYDIDRLAGAGLVSPDWRTRYPHDAAPFYSTVLFVVRAGNPKKIRDWEDLAREGVEVVTPNPRTSGGGRWNYLAAWAYAARAHPRDPSAARDFVARLYRNVSVFDTASRGAATTFIRRGIGDVLIAWESEAFLAMEEAGADRLEIVTPSISMRADTPVAIVERNADRRRVREIADSYLTFLYSKPAQRIGARYHFRPSDPEIAAETRFAEIPLLTVDEAFGGWEAAYAEHFASGGVFDQIMAERR